MEYAEENNARAPCVIVNDSTRKAKMEEEVKMQDAVVLLGAVREKLNPTPYSLNAPAAGCRCSPWSGT
jgi:hypothetical protein